jgi:predicted nucleic acid-binding protein
MALIQALRETSLVLDTDVFTHWRNQQPLVKKAIADYQSYHKVLPALTSTTVFETFSGIEAEAAKLTANQESIRSHRAQAERFVQNCVVLPFDQSAAAIAAYIFPRLSQSDRNKHWRDVFIAATALSHRYGIASRNRKDFELIASHLPLGQQLHLAVWKP